MSNTTFRSVKRLQLEWLLDITYVLYFLFSLSIYISKGRTWLRHDNHIRRASKFFIILKIATLNVLIFACANFHKILFNLFFGCVVNTDYCKLLSWFFGSTNFRKCKMLFCCAKFHSNNLQWENHVTWTLNVKVAAYLKGRIFRINELRL